MMCGHQASQQSTKPFFLLQGPERDCGPRCSILYGHQASHPSFLVKYPKRDCGSLCSTMHGHSVLPTLSYQPEAVHLVIWMAFVELSFLVLYQKVTKMCSTVHGQFTSLPRTVLAVQYLSFLVQYHAWSLGLLVEYRGFLVQYPERDCGS